MTIVSDRIIRLQSYARCPAAGQARAAIMNPLRT